jgi:hypothetical protein
VTTCTINEALERFVEAGSEPGAGPRREGVVELFRLYLDNYACETLDQADRSRWERAVEADEDAGSFCNPFGPERLLEGLDAFLGWFVIRTVLGPRGTGETAARVCVDLVRWPVDEGYVRTYGPRRGGVRR